MILNNKDYEQYQKIIKTQKIIRFSKIFLSLIILSLAVITIYNFELVFNNEVETNNKILHGCSGPECSNLSFQLTAICLNNYVREMPFVYNITDDDVDLTIQDLKERGGDCRDFTNFYLEYMEFYGYDQDNQIVKGLVEKNETVAIYHVSLMSFDSTGYCHFDMTDLECYKYINRSGEVKS